MDIEFKELVVLCDDELVSREYSSAHLFKIREEWDRLSKWMSSNQYSDFSESVGFAYCDEVFGSHILTDNISESDQMGIRAVRMLTSYQKDGDFEFRTPRIEQIYSGEVGKAIESYLSHTRNILHLSEKTISNKEHYLYKFNVFLNEQGLLLDDLNIDRVEHFFTSMRYSPPSRHNCASTLRIFLRYTYENKMTRKDHSLYIPSNNYRKQSKIPTTYDESEIRRIIASVERSSAIGKRDYLILLLAAEYGWRSKDITNFGFDQIDWDKNVIRFYQSKTDVPVEYPLLSSIGNAIIDYLKHGRPKTDAKEIIVAANNLRKGKPLSSPTIHSIVSKYMRRADIKDWKNKKHGAHSLRHSLASNMLKKNIAMPVISTVMGHQSTETTKIYLNIDILKLKQSPLPMPKLRSAHFRQEVQ